jgi:hypothetical protein
MGEWLGNGISDILGSWWKMQKETIFCKIFIKTLYNI